ncbi:NAD(P)/FAD-dependent oxidoreductase [Paracoccus sp. MBLB3053]|uniref:NAD(P)/FAD-dependent oxidoreductase n=1 Tax=Paracoccus aurantius TaxID=3073814 RepID=A0ABU2HZT3_9RHOB|nr:NAD(P)/FAD-dependent oxidoreductase [Paracoccus sp. MBLB3053]MDS9470060.1 NAD(P)/FAD-dependent oxidoreductase [Paracoccus sp. MBLB3053]
MTQDHHTVAILGAGPAGLTAAYCLQKQDGRYRPVIFEAQHIVGGLSRTECLDGYRFDIGGHRFFTKIPEIEAMWREVLGKEMIRVQRQSRIHYRGKFFDYPLKPLNALRNIGPYETIRILLSLLKWRVRPSPREDTFTQWVINRFGGRLYMHFFHSYTLKVWGTQPQEIRADWAAQRIQNLSLWRAITTSFGGRNKSRSLIEEFDYPRLGPGQMWEETAQQVTKAGGELQLGTEVVKLRRDGMRITEIGTRPRHAGPDAPITWAAASHVISSLDLRTLIRRIDPPPPPEVCAAAEKLRYRDFLIVTLILDHPDPFPDNWIYVHTDVKVGRIQNFRAWSRDMVPDQHTSSIGMEYFCQKGDGLWAMPDDELRALAASELEQLGLAKANTVIKGAVIRQPKAYPVYDNEYQKALSVIRPWLSQLENFQTVGRNGLHRYNNQDHSMLSAMYAVENIRGANHDLWNVNVERSYHEEFEVAKPAAAEPDGPAAAPLRPDPGSALGSQSFPAPGWAKGKDGQVPTARTVR